MTSNLDTKMPEPQESTLLGALKTAKTTIVARPASKTAGPPQRQPLLEQLTDLEFGDLEAALDGDINFGTDSGSELQGTSNTLPLYEPPDREDWQQDLHKPKQKKKNRRWSRSFSTDCAFFNSKVGTYDINPPRGRLRTDTRGDILDSYDTDNEQGPRTLTPTKFDTYGSSQDIRQQGP